MKKLRLISLFIIAICFIACTKDGVEDNTTPIIPDVPVVQKQDTLITLKTSITGEEFPFNGLINSHIIYGNQLYILDDSVTYAFDLDLKKLTIVNANNSGISSYMFGYSNSNFSFIKDNNWYYWCDNNFYTYLLRFDFTTKSWQLIQKFDKFVYGLGSPIGIFENNRLFIFDTANAWYNTQEVFEYNFESKLLIKVGSHNFKLGVDLLSQSVFRYNDNIYLLFPLGYYSAKVYKYDVELHNFTELCTFGLLENNESISGGIACLYKDKIIFGMGSTGRVVGQQTVINSNFYYYDITKNKFARVTNKVSTASLYSQLYKYEDNYFVFGGYLANDSINHSVVKLEFSEMIK